MKTKMNNPSSRRRQAGVSMIELLVAFVIFSFGMLGLAGLQIKTMAYSQNSLFRSQAMALTDDVLDRMRADRSNAKLSTNGWNTQAITSASSMSGNLDLKEWKGVVEGLLPDGKASIVVGVDGDATVAISWNEKGETVTFTTVTQL